MIQSRMRRWLTDILVGGVVGGVVGAIVAVNFVIYVGIDRGYEASIADVFRQNTLAGSATVAILAPGSRFSEWWSLGAGDGSGRRPRMTMPPNIDRPTFRSAFTRPCICPVPRADATGTPLHLPPTPPPADVAQLDR